MNTQVRLKVAAEMYAVPVEHVLEVTDLGHVTVVPGSHPEMLGVRNLRGQVLPVVDLALLLRVQRTEPARRLLVAEAAGRQAGFAIDEASDVGEMPEPTEEAESTLLRGAVLTGGNLIGIIDVPRVFDHLERTIQ